MTMKERWLQLSRTLTKAFTNLLNTGRGSKLNQEKSVPLQQEINRQEVITIPIGSLTAKDLEVKVENGYLMIAANQAKSLSKHVVGTRAYFTQKQSLNMMVPIRSDITAQMVEARVNDGILRVTMPYDLETVENSARQIKIS